MADIDLGILAEFLVDAKKAAYAGEGAEVKSQRPGFKELEYKDDRLNLEYIDSYTGFFLAPGQEVVRFDGKPVWVMSYSGGMLGGYREDIKFAKNVFAFLKKALSNVPIKIPFRGPTHYDGQGFKYRNKIEGDIRDFSGIETISYNGEEVFRQRYIGGLVKSK